MKEIGRETFRGCKTLSSVTLPEGLEEIGAGAFRDCVSLSEIAIPASVNYIGETAFLNCDGLERAVFADPSGWTVENAERSALPAELLGEPIVAAEYLNKKYCIYAWRRSV